MTTDGPIGLERLAPGDARLASSSDPRTARAYVVGALGGAEGGRERTLEVIDAELAGGPVAADRRTRPAHLTGSAIVVDPVGRRTVLMLHAKLGIWVQPGGHADGETNLALVALTEAAEETGMAGLTVLVPAIDVDVHRVDPPAEDAHLHLDVRFVVLAPPGAEPVGNHESTDLGWVALDDVATLGVNESVVRPCAAADRMLRAGFGGSAQTSGGC